MTGVLVYTPRMQWVDNEGAPYALATAQFYLTNSTTPHAIYQDADLGTPYVNPVTADDAGMFPPIYLDKNVQYRMVVKDETAAFTIADVDPVNALFSVGASDIEDGAIEAKLGYTPVDPDNAVFTSPARLTFASPVTALHVDDVGFRGSPPNIKNTNYTLSLDDAGYLLIHDDVSNFTWTIPNNADVSFPVGACFYVAVLNTGTISLHRDTDVALRTAGSGTDGDITVNQYDLLCVRQTAVDQWVAK